MDRLRHLWLHHRSVLIAFFAVLCAVLFFGAKTITSAIYWMDPAHQDQDIAPWMTPRYVAHSYQLPPEVLGPALFLDKDAQPHRMSLGKIAADNGMTLEDLQMRIDAAAEKWRAEQDE